MAHAPDQLSRLQSGLVVLGITISGLTPDCLTWYRSAATWIPSYYFPNLSMRFAPSCLTKLTKLTK